MKKGKGKSKKNIKKSNKSLSKEVKKKKGVSNSNKSIKSSKDTKKSNKSKLSLKQKAKKILSKETWRDTRDIKGKLKKGRKKSIKLITQGDANRYQQIVKAISDYYKKAGTPLKRKDLYKEYRRVRDEYSNTPLSVLIPQFNRIVIQKKGTRQFPPSLTLGIPWYQFEDEMTANFSQSYFKLNDTIILDLSLIRPKIPNMRFPYKNIIGNYKKLYNNINFRQSVKKKSTYFEFEYDPNQSNIKKGIYVFVLNGVGSGTSVIQSPMQPKGKSIPTPQTPLPKPIGDLLGYNDKSEYIKQISNYTDMKKNISKAFANKEMTYQQYRMELDDINEEIADLQNKINNL